MGAPRTLHRRRVTHPQTVDGAWPVAWNTARANPTRNQHQVAASTATIKWVAAIQVSVSLIKRAICVKRRVRPSDRKPFIAGIWMQLVAQTIGVARGYHIQTTLEYHPMYTSALAHGDLAYGQLIRFTAVGLRPPHRVVCHTEIPMNADALRWSATGNKSANRLETIPMLTAVLVFPSFAQPWPAPVPHEKIRAHFRQKPLAFSSFPPSSCSSLLSS